MGCRRRCRGASTSATASRVIRRNSTKRRSSRGSRGTWHARACVSRPPVNGDLYKLFMVSYLGLRLAIDFIKPGLAFGGLTSIQWVCLLTLVHYRRDIARWNVPQHPSGAEINQ